MYVLLVNDSVAGVYSSPSTAKDEEKDLVKRKGWKKSDSCESTTSNRYYFDRSLQRQVHVRTIIVGVDEKARLR